MQGLKQIFIGLIFSVAILPGVAITAPLIQSQQLPPINATLTPPLRDINPTNLSIQPRRIIPLRRQRNASPFTLSPPPRDLIQQIAPVTLMKPPLLSFEGLKGKDNDDIFGTPSVPPDVNGDIGPRHYVQMVNTLLQVFDKQTGAKLTKALKLSSIFAAAGKTGPCAKYDDGDPIVLYDELADRWLLSQFASNYNKWDIAVAPHYECIAISQTNDPTGAYYLYAHIMPNKFFGDYPKFGVGTMAYYLTVVQYDKNDEYAGVGIFAFDREKMLHGQPVTVNYHDLGEMLELSSLLPADLDGEAPLPDLPHYVLGFNTNRTFMPKNQIRIFEIRPDFSSTDISHTIQEQKVVAVQSFNPNVCNSYNMACIPQAKVRQKLDSLSDRPLYRLQYRHFVDNCPVDKNLSSCVTLTFNHTVRANTDGINRSGVRWYILTMPLDGDQFQVAHQGTFSPDKHFRWMGSAALNRKGDLALGYSISSSELHPTIGYAGRFANDPLNTITQERILSLGKGSQTAKGDRWGDYTMMAVDPIDGCTFWYSNQYYRDNEDGYNWYWRSRIFSFKLSSNCD